MCRSGCFCIFRGEKQEFSLGADYADGRGFIICIINGIQRFYSEKIIRGPYSKCELARAYAPDIAPTSALNRLAQWIRLNRPLSEALRETGYYARQHVFTSRQVELIFHYLGRP